MTYGVTELVVNSRPVEQPSAINLKDGDRWNAVFGGNSKTKSGVKITHKSVIGYPPFWRGVNLLANSVAGLPIDVFRRTGDDRVVAKTHPAQKLLKRSVNPILRSRKFRKTMMSHALLFGNGYAKIERDERFRPMELWPLDPQSMIIRYFEGELWYCTTINGEQKKFPGRDIIHVTGLSHDGVAGYSAVKLFAEALGVGMAAQEFGARFFGSGTNTSGVLMIPGSMKEDRIRNTLKAWDEMQSGLKNSHKIALLQEGAKFQKMSTDPDSAQFLETRNFEVRAVVASILGVPPHLLGDDTRTSHNSLEAENQSYLTHSLAPWLNEFEGEFELKLLTEREQDRDSHFVEFNREAAVQMLFETKVDGIYRQVEMGQLNIDEGRKLFNMPALPNGEGQKRFRPANWIELGAEPEMQPNNTPPPVETDEDDSQSATLRALVESSVTKSLALEGRKVVAAATKEPNFCGWLDSYYDGWVRAAVSEMSDSAAMDVKIEYADESKRQLLDVAGSSTSATLVDNVSALVATWDDRGETLTDGLMGTI